MKQGGAFLAIILAISGIVRFAGPGTPSRNSSNDSAAAIKKNPHPQSEYTDDLRKTIQEFYGVWAPDKDKEKEKEEARTLASYWNVPESQELTRNHQKITSHPRDDVHFAIAILPDPLHTRLALLFDRSIEAIQEAAEREGYEFDRAIFPWDRASVPQSDDVDKRREAAEVQKAREKYPGLLIFRGVSHDDADKPIDFPAPLFVFVVGEAPTSGIRKKQFQNAMKIVKEIRKGNGTRPSGEDSLAKSRPLLILGPSTSGSLRSLKRELSLLGSSKAFVYSGGITDVGSISDFTNQIDPAIHFASFQENDDFIRDRFLQFACHDGYKPDEIATLSEGDTAYGSGVSKTGPDATRVDANSQNDSKPAGEGNSRTDQAPPPEKNCSDAQIVRLRFPREISYFRAAYQNQTASQRTSSPDIPVPQAAAVALNPEEIGTDDDAALPYAGAQTPATQEAVMLGIIGELNKHHTKFTILYASDPLDQVFLARYLRTKYPRGRVVVTDPDLLLFSQEDSSLRGVLGINTYPIVPGLNDTFCSWQLPTPPSSSTSPQTATSSQTLTPVHGHDDRLFVSSTSIGTFNAMLALLAESENADANAQATADAAPRSTAKPADGQPLAEARAKTQNPTITTDGAGKQGENVGKQAADTQDSEGNSDEIVVPPVPSAPYAEYATPVVHTLSSSSKDFFCYGRPLVWLMILGQDGFWPVVGLSDEDLQTFNRNEPILQLSRQHPQSTNPIVTSQDSSKFVLSAPPDDHLKSDQPNKGQDKDEPGEVGQGKSDEHNDDSDDSHLRLPPAWKISYCFAVFLLALHMFLSLNGSILADSEPRAQFARIDNWRDVTVIALGALALATAFVTIMFSGGPVIGELGVVSWFSLWLPLPVFVVITTYDLSWLRNQWHVAAVFAAVTFVMFVIETLVWLTPRDFTLFWTLCGGSDSCTCKWIAQRDVLHSAFWSTRLLHYTSGVSPVLPILFLAAAGYWWMWQSLRGVTLVDRRRPRLPERSDPVGRWYRINDHEAAKLRNTAHPLVFKPSVVIVLIILGVFLMTVVDIQHPVQTVEGWAYDWIYAILLSVMIGTLLGILLKLVFTWLKCAQILSGLDRLPLRDEFSRMKQLSWHSLWNPGGSTLRATYKVLLRGIDCLGRLRSVLRTVDDQAPVELDVRVCIQKKIQDAMDALDDATAKYKNVVDPFGNAGAKEMAGKTLLGRMAQSFHDAATEDPYSTEQHPLGKRRRKLCGDIAVGLDRYMRETVHLPKMMEAVEKLQVAMADAAAEIVERMLEPWWQCERAPVVSEDDRFKKEKLPLTRLLAEEFVALVYVNFLITVLLRMRTMVMAAIGMYVFIVLSMNVYPFEPHAALQTLAVVLLAVMGAALAFVYAQMHRDQILSRLTSTTSGELGWDFWLKLASAGAIPVFSLLAVQFPEINRFLFSWLEPALQAVK
jgi:hypothetical protein